MSEQVRGWLFWIVPALACAALLAVRADWAQRLSVTLLALGPLTRAFAYTWAWLMFLLPGGDVGTPAGYYIAVPWFVLSGWVAAAALAPNDWSYLGREGVDDDRPDHTP